MVLLIAFLWVTVDALVEQIYLHQSSSQRMREKCATILHINPNITVATCFYNCDALSLRNDTIHICSFCACTQKKVTDVHAYPDEADFRLFNKLLRYLNVATVIYKWCVLEH